MLYFLKIKIFISLDSCKFVEHLFKIKIYIFQFLNTKKGDTVLLRINAGGVHLILDIFWGAFIQGRRLHEGGVY